MKKKIALLSLKVVPCVGALCCAANSMLSYFGIKLAWLGYVAIIVFISSWYLLARYFKFCSFYFMLLYYIITCEVVNIIDFKYHLPFSDKHMFVLHVALFGFYTLLYTYLHVRDSRKTKKHIAQDR